MNVHSSHPSRGELVDVGGRRLRLVRAGPSTERPTIILECGAFGCAADWAVVQDKLAVKGLHSLAYDRAGLGYSDPGPRPRDGQAIAADLEALLAAAGEAGPYIIAGHSMGGLLVRVFMQRNPGQVLGVVLVDAATPEVMDARALAAGVHAYRGAMRVVGVTARAGVIRPVRALMGDLIGLDGEAAIEKRRIDTSSSHTHWAAEEVQHWAVTSLQGRDAFDPGLPVAVITAGPERGTRTLKAIQVAPATASKHGYVEHVTRSNHASLLGKKFGDPVVRGIEHVLAAVDR